MASEEVDRGLRRLASDLAAGIWDKKYGALRQRETYDVGYRFIVARDQG